MIKVLCCWTVTIVMGLLFCGCGPDYQKILVESAAEDLQGEPARYGSITCALGPVEFVDFTEKRVCDNPRLARKVGFDTLVVGVFRRTPAPDGRKYYETRGQTVYFNPTHDLVFQLGRSGFGPLYEHFADKLSYKQVFQWLGDFSKMKAKKYYEIDPATSYRFELKKEMQVLDGEVAMVFMLEKGWYFNSVWDIEHLNEKDDCETFLICDCDGHLSNESEKYVKEMNAFADELNHRLKELVAIGNARKDVKSLSVSERAEIESFVKFADDYFSRPVPHMKVPL